MTAASNSDACKRIQPAEDTAPAETLAERLAAMRLTDGEREGIDRASSVLGWQHLVRYSGMSREWLDLTLAAMVRSARVEQARAGEGALSREVEDLRSRLACVREATYWDRPYDTRVAAIRGMCDLTTDGMTPAVLAEGDPT